jgi:hypothetical protein
VRRGGNTPGETPPIDAYRRFRNRTSLERSGPAHRRRSSAPGARRAHTSGTGSSHRDPRFAPTVAPSRISGTSATAGVAAGMWMSALLRKPRRRASLDDGLGRTRADWSSAHESGTSHQLVATAPGTTREHPLDHTRRAGDVRRVQRAVQPSHRMVVQERINIMPLARSLGTVRRARNRVDIA